MKNLFSTNLNILKNIFIKKVSPKNKLFLIPSVMMSAYILNFAKKAYLGPKPEISPNDKRLLINLPRLEEMEEGEMKEVKWGTKDNQSILVVKYQGKLRALSNYCPHFGAPLHTGVLIDNIIKCPWHGASFDVISGKTDISPAINDLPIYTVETTDEGDNFVILQDKDKVANNIAPSMSKRDPNDKRRFIIVGGGPAGLSAAETLRQANYTGEILIISKDVELPYDRTILSKYYPGSVSKILLRSQDFLKEYDIDIKTSTSIDSIDNKKREVVLSNGTKLTYDKLLISSGSRPFVPPIEGVNRPNVLTLRSYADLENLTQKAKNAKNIVIVGGGFIGLECVGMLKKLNPEASITVVDGYETPFYNTLGKEVGAALQHFHESKGIKFALKRSVKKITDSGIELSDGTSMEGDMILLGTGVSPNTVTFFFKF